MNTGLEWLLKQELEFQEYTALQDNYVHVNTFYLIFFHSEEQPGCELGVGVYPQKTVLPEVGPKLNKLWNYESQSGVNVK